MTSPRVLFAAEAAKLKRRINEFSVKIRKTRALRLMYQGILNSFQTVEHPSEHALSTIREYQQKLSDLPPISEEEEALAQLQQQYEQMFIQ